MNKPSHEYCKECNDWNGNIGKCMEICGIPIDIINEWEKYRAIGSVDECRSAVEKQKAKKVLKPLTSYSLGTCPVCTEHQLGRWEHCRSCGQKFDWSDEE